MADRLLLASASPRRAELLARSGFAFEVVPSGADESIPQGLGPQAVAATIAHRKADAVISARSGPHRGDEVVLAADTIVVLGSEILGKPADLADGARMLRMLGGRTHAVVTGFALARGDGSAGMSNAVETAVQFKPVTEEEIAAYLSTGEPMDKAGAYAIQGIGGFLVRAIHGSYSNVVGLPLVEVIDALAAMSDLRPFMVPPQP